MVSEKTCGFYEKFEYNFFDIVIHTIWVLGPRRTKPVVNSA